MIKRKMIKYLTVILILIFMPSLQGKTNKNRTEETDTLHEAMFYEKLPGERVKDHLCPHECMLEEGQTGLCGARKNINGKLYTLTYGKPVAIHIDPIEKKPFFHVLPGSRSFSIATAGCNLRCIFCQNWQISQANPSKAKSYKLSPEQIVNIAEKNNCSSIAYTYTEPTIFYEYMLDIAKIARQRGILNVMHTCGFIKPKPLRNLCKYMDAANVDLKGFAPDFYTKMSSGKLEPVLKAIKIIKEEGVWLEITNLIIPNSNDDTEVIRNMCEWIKENVGVNVPLHLSRFYPNYKLQSLPPTPVETLEKARKIAMDVGLNYVYIGNVPGHPAENTYSPYTKRVLIKRSGYTVTENNIINGKSKFTSKEIPGIWKEEEE